MATWSRVFGGGVITVQGSCSTGCYNVTEPDQGVAKPTIFDEITATVGSIAGGIGYWAEQLRRRLAGTMLITATSETLYTLELRRGTRTDTITWQVATNQGVYPLIVSYVAPRATGTATFQNIGHAIDWLVSKLA